MNVLLAFFLAAVLAALYWYVWRPLPQHSGSIPVPVAAPATVAFDTLGVPHIQAASQEDAFIAQGYVTAQDRLWQMDSLRRLAGGNLAEVVGPGALDLDRQARQLRLRRIAEEGYTRLAPADRAAFAAYTQGVNQFIATHLNDLPVEFTLLGYQPKPWSAVDSLLICLNMYRDLTTTWHNDIIKQNMLKDGDSAKVNYLFAARSGDEPMPGSNGWAVAGSHTASGKPLLSNDMHLEYSLPGIWYMTHLAAPGLDVSGVSLPGVPGVIVGHNQHIAWGITNLEFDVQDLYVEKMDSAGHYLFKGQVQQARDEHEIIPVKGSRPVEMTVTVTGHGPIVLGEGSERVSLRWTAAEPGFLQYPVLDIDRAQNWQQFTAAIARWTGPGSNFVYADTDGNIGYHAAGKLPKRHGFDGALPLDGASGNFEWDGYMSFDELPSAYNPPSGIIATANQNPFPADFPYPVNGNFAPPDRSRRIRDLLSAHNGWHAADMLGVQTDIYSAFSKFLASQVVAAYDRRGAKNPSIDPAVALLRSWDGRMDRDQGAPFLASLLYQHLRNTVADSASPGKGQLYEYTMGPAVIGKLLRDRPAGWFQNYDAVLLRTLIDSVDEAKRIQGDSPARWKYGSYFRVEIDQPVLHGAMQRIPVIGPMLDTFEVGPVPMSGSSTTVKQTTRALAPSMRMNADLSDWDRSLLNIQIGQSGQPFSGHYKDEWKDYYSGKSYPMQFQHVQSKSTLELRPLGSK
ncbi:MAG TPA: penicillin acylase family protein [Bryobacteraceae bacterium]|jgi:penicillin amidase|nr:penicillin acylase family protein [Bryobacteraceae bacterium]